ncbi:MAG: hypothetical protein HKN04_05760 [Rhodothermaceae bacterium]|nr:hypothetical protein [Rhodothermaceae bacterium]
MKRLLPLLCLLALAIGCDTSDPVLPSVAPVTMYVGNQGNFSDNNGTITAYDLDTGAVRQDVVPNLGGLVQRVLVGSYVTSGEEFFVLLNFDDSFSTGAGRIDEVNVDSGERTQQMPVNTPRDLAAVGGGRAYVSNLYAGTVTPVDLIAGTAGAPIAVGANPEGLIAIGNRLYVANSGFGFGTAVSVVDIAQGAVIETLEGICVGPRTLLADAEAEVWVFCSGTSDFNTGEVIDDGAVVVLNGATGAEVARMPVTGVLGAASLGQDAAFSATHHEMAVVVGAEVLRFDTRSNTLLQGFEVSGAPISAVAYSETEGRLYLGRLDPTNPFAAAGFVSVHSLGGTEVDRLEAGIAPASIAFTSGTIEG